MATVAVSSDALDQPRDWAARLAPLSGIVFAILLVAGVLVATITPDYTNSQAWSTFFTDRGNRVRVIIGCYLMIVSAFSFLWFYTGIVHRLDAVRAGSSRLRTAVSASGLLFIGLLLVSATVLIAVPASIGFGSAPAPGGDFGIQFQQLGYGLLLVPGMLAAALFVFLVSLSAMRTRLLPVWLAWAGVVVAVLLLLGPLFFPAVLLPIWTLVTGAVLLTHPQGALPEPR